MNIPNVLLFNCPGVDDVDSILYSFLEADGFSFCFDCWTFWILENAVLSNLSLVNFNLTEKSSVGFLLGSSDTNKSSHLTHLLRQATHNLRGYIVKKILFIASGFLFGSNMFSYAGPFQCIKDALDRLSLDGYAVQALCTGAIDSSPIDCVINAQKRLNFDGYAALNLCKGARTSNGRIDCVIEADKRGFDIYSAIRFCKAQ